jgi:hypothetical protein
MVWRTRQQELQKRWKKCVRWCMIDDDIDDCDCDRLRDDFTALRTEYQEHHGRAYDDFIVLASRRPSKPKLTQELFLGTLMSTKSEWLIHRTWGLRIGRHRNRKEFVNCLWNLSSERIWMTLGFRRVLSRLLFRRTRCRSWIVARVRAPMVFWFCIASLYALQQVIGNVYLPREMETLVCYSHFQK